jgi:hypothetical protein
VTLPKELEGWSAPGFDDRQWRRGKAPIGKGLFQRDKTTFENHSEWGPGEFLVMRTTFELKMLEHDFYRISVLANQGFHLYLNVHKIHGYDWWKDMPHKKMHYVDQLPVATLDLHPLKQTFGRQFNVVPRWLGGFAKGRGPGGGGKAGRQGMPAGEWPEGGPGPRPARRAPGHLRSGGRAGRRRRQCCAGAQRRGQRRSLLGRSDNAGRWVTPG